MRPTSIRIFLAEGRPEGLRIVEKSNWTGRAVVAGRGQVEAALARPELGQPGVYVLTGPVEDGLPRVYVGEADVLRNRLIRHVSGKDFWTRFVAFVSTNESLNKAYIRYIEARLLELAGQAKQWAVENTQFPPRPPLSEPDQADAEWFLQEMLVIFPLLGVDAFEVASSTASVEQEGSNPPLFLDERGAVGQGREVGDGFVIFAGSRARAKEVPSISQGTRQMRAELLANGVLKASGEHLVFTQDYRFGSPSAASCVLVAGSSNGRRAWKDEQGRALKALQRERAEQARGV